MEAMSANWTAVYNRLFKLIDGPKDVRNVMYYSGPRYIEKIQEIRPDCVGYNEYKLDRERSGLSTSRRDYFKDLLMWLTEHERFQFVTSIIDEAPEEERERCDEIRMLMGGGTRGPAASIPTEAWNADRLNKYLRAMDEALGDKEYERTVTLAYTCLEGFFKAFFVFNFAGEEPPNEIIDLAREVKFRLKHDNTDFPDEVTNLVTQTAHAVNKTRNGFSDSHFGDKSEEWLATFMRDLVNTQVRLLLHFM